MRSATRRAEEGTVAGVGHSPHSDLSVLTPVRDMRAMLPRCVASVADQGVAGVHHLVLDGGSTDGTVAWLRDHGTEGFGGEPGLHWDRRADRGMYDALNRGLDAAAGGIVGFLNADEQYLPGTLAFVGEWFARHPEVDILAGNYLVVDEHGRLLAFRKEILPRWPYILATHLYTFTCALFMRSRVFDGRRRFDPSFKAAGDAEFVVRSLREGFRAAHARRYCSTFTLGTRNLTLDPSARLEAEELLARAPGGVRRLRPVLRLARRAGKFLAGGYRERFPLRYSIYAADLARRTPFTATSASSRWPG